MQVLPPPLSGARGDLEPHLDPRQHLVCFGSHDHGERCALPKRVAEASNDRKLDASVTPGWEDLQVSHVDDSAPRAVRELLLEPVAIEVPLVECLELCAVGVKHVA